MASLDLCGSCPSRVLLSCDHVCATTRPHVGTKKILCVPRLRQHEHRLLSTGQFFTVDGTAFCTPVTTVCLFLCSLSSYDPRQIWSSDGKRLIYFFDAKIAPGVSVLDDGGHFTQVRKRATGIQHAPVRRLTLWHYVSSHSLFMLSLLALLPLPGLSLSISSRILLPHCVFSMQRGVPSRLLPAILRSPLSAFNIPKRCSIYSL